MGTLLEAAETIAFEAARLRGQGIGLGPSNPDRVKMHLDAALPKRTAGELGLAPAKCICDPMDLAALGHMLSCPCFTNPN